MNIFRRFRDALAILIEGQPLTDPAVTRAFGFGAPTAAGQVVSQETAMTISAVYAAVEIKSSLRASLPVGVYRKERGGRKEEADLHPAQRVLSIQPNPEMTPKMFWQTLEVYGLLWGNALAEITWDGGGNVRELWPLEPWRLRPERRNGRLGFLQDGQRWIDDRDVIRRPHLSYDGVWGRSVLTWARESMGLTLAADRFGAEFFGRGGVPSGVLEHPGKLDPKSRENIRGDWKKVHSPAEGGRNGEIAVLWEGMKYQKVGLPPGDAQFLDTRKFQVAEIARWFNIPPHMLKDLAQANYSTIEQQQIEFVLFSLLPGLIEWEQEIDRKLLTPPRLYSKHCVRALMRGDMAAQANFFRQMFGIGVYSINEIKELLDENPIGPDGDRHFVPMNMIDVTKVDEAMAQKQAAPGAGPPSQKGPAGDPGAGDPYPGDAPLKAAITAAETLFADAVQRMMRREGKRLLWAAEKPQAFLALVDELYQQQEPLFADSIKPALTAWLQATGRENDPDEAARQIAAAHSAKARVQLLAACECQAAELPARIRTLLDQWQASPLTEFPQAA